MNLINKFNTLIIASLVFLAASPVMAHAGNVGWNVSVGGGYGGGWRPLAYGAYGPVRGPGWRGNWTYGDGYYGPYVGYFASPVIYPPPVIAYMPSSQPMVLAAQPQPAVWYYCAVSDKYFPFIEECPSGWQVQSANSPTSSAQSKQPQR
jgi:hypothetical protein